MMFKSKHSGWTWDLKRTPFGGGGSWNPVNIIEDAVSSVSDAVAQVDPGPSISQLIKDSGFQVAKIGSSGGDLFSGIGNTLASIDPSHSISQGLAEADTFVNREIPGGWALPAAIAAAYATGYIDPSLFASEAAATAGAEAGAGAIATEAGQAAFFEALASGATSTEAVSAGLGADSIAASLATGGTDAALQGPTYGELGYTGVPEGGMGPTYAEMGNTGLNTEQAISAADAAAQNSQLAEALKTANQVRQGVGTANNLAKMLTSGAGSQLSGAAQNFAQGQTGIASAIPALIRGNQNPFLQTAQQPIQNKKTDLASLIELLKQG
jgi:hypothetical protein